MLGFLKRLFGGADTPATPSRSIEITAADLQSADTLGPKLALLAQARAGITSAEYDPARQVLLIAQDNGFQASIALDNALSALRGRGAQEQADYIDNLLTPVASTTVEAPRLLPVLKSADFLAKTRAQLRDMDVPDAEITDNWHREVAPGLILLLALDSPQQTRLLLPDDVAELGQDDAALVEQAVDNLSLYAQEVGINLAEQPSGAVHQVQMDENYDASLFFADHFWSAVAEDMQATRLAGLFAARNLVMVGNADRPEAVAELRQIGTALPADLPYAIAPGQLYQWQGQGWTVLPAT